MEVRVLSTAPCIGMTRSFIRCLVTKLELISSLPSCPHWTFVLRNSAKSKTDCLLGTPMANPSRADCLTSAAARRANAFPSPVLLESVQEGKSLRSFTRSPKTMPWRRWLGSPPRSPSRSFRIEVTDPPAVFPTHPPCWVEAIPSVLHTLPERANVNRRIPLRIYQRNEMGSI